MDYKMEYEKAVDEIKILKVTLSKVCGYEYKEELPITLILQQLTLENKILYFRIKKLETMLDEQIEINKSQQIEIVSLKQENNALKLDNQKLNDKVDKLNDTVSKLNGKLYHLNNTVSKLVEKEEYNNLTIAIQDINHMYLLEQTLKNSSFSNLRKNRNDEFHYILENEPQELKDAKITVLYEKLNNLKDNIRKKMNRQYPNVIRDVLSQIKPIHPISDVHLEQANDWWD
jgi:hypothetical protein